MNGWNIADPFMPSPELLAKWAELANKPRELPRMKRGDGFYTMPKSYPWGLPARKCEVCNETDGCVTVEPVPVDGELALTGSIGYIQDVTIITDVFVPNYKYQTKHIYSLVHKRGKVMIYVWERNPAPDAKEVSTYWYEYRSAREARVDMKRYGIGRRGW
jgi:hypothetical protein